MSHPNLEAILQLTLEMQMNLVMILYLVQC